MSITYKKYINKKPKNPIDFNIEDHDEEDDKENNENNEIISISSTNSHTSSSSIGNRTKRRYSRKKSNKKTPVPSYKFDSSCIEDHKSVIYGVVFNYYLTLDSPPIFATVGSNRCSIYQCENETGIKLLSCYADPDPKESFFTCIWSLHSITNEPLLIFAGNHGIIRIMEVSNNKNLISLIGHGGSINQLKIHPLQTNLLLSCSKDYGIRLWNINTSALIAIFAGTDGHRSEVLTIAFDANGERFISGGMDHALKIWNIKHDEIEKRIELSKTFDEKSVQKQFPTYMQHYPDCTTRDVHGNYVDCVQWFGNFIISKSCEDLIIIWQINNSNNKTLVTSGIEKGLRGLRRFKKDIKPEIIAEFECKNCQLWFVRFDFNVWQNFIACGNELGEIHVWELSQTSPKDSRIYTLKHKECKTTVRQVSFSKNAKILIAVCDDGTIWRWNKQ